MCFRGRPRQFRKIEDSICFNGYKALPKIIKAGVGTYYGYNYHLHYYLPCGDHLYLDYTIDGQERHQEIDLVFQEQPFGGTRALFQCPSMLCGLPVTKLYIPSGEYKWACRKCYHLLNQSSRDSHKCEAMLKYIAGNVGITLKEVKKILKRR